MPGRNFSSDKYRFGFNGKEKLDELHGNSGDAYDFGARLLDVRLGIFLSIDPLMKKYPNESNYIYFGNNPIIYFDSDGKDKVWFNCEGTEVKRIVSKTEFHTYAQVGVEVSERNGQLHQKGVFKEAPMPGIIADKEDPKYQNLDYQIAASTFLFNQKLINNDELPHTKDHQITNQTERPNIDVNLVKAMVMQESSMGQPGKKGTGTGDVDPIQSNVPRDFEKSKDIKIAVGLTYRQIMNPRTSINAGIGILFLKGMVSDTKGNYTTWQGNETAVGRYGPGGDYAKSVLNYFNSMTPAKPANYYLTPSPKKDSKKEKPKSSPSF